MARPYRKNEDNLLAIASMAALTLIYMFSMVIKTCEEFAAEAPQLTQRILGFTSPSELTGLAIAFAFALLGVLAQTFLTTMRNEQRMQVLRLKVDGSLPKLTLKPEQVWMLFISHA